MLKLVKRKRNEEKKSCRGFFEIPTHLIRSGVFLTRTVTDNASLCNLASSIKKHGILQPLLVTCTKNGCYELCAGERRLRAARLVGLSRVPCIVISESECEYASVVENLQREPLSTYDRARAVNRIYEWCDKDLERTAELLSQSPDRALRSVKLCALSVSELKTLSRLGVTEETALEVCGLYGRERELAIERLSRSKENCRGDIDITVSESERGESRDDSVKRRKSKAILRSLLPFENTLSKSVAVLESAGYSVSLEMSSTDEKSIYTVEISRGDKKKGE